VYLTTGIARVQSVRHEWNQAKGNSTSSHRTIARGTLTCKILQDILGALLTRLDGEDDDTDLDAMVEDGAQLSAIRPLLAGRLGRVVGEMRRR
jgi:hypothetical protein